MRTIDRRGFLRTGAAAALGAAGLDWLSACSGRVAALPTPRPLPWNALARSLRGRLLRPGDAGFAAYAQPNNLRYAAVLPAGIALCADPGDVATAIGWARDYGVALVPRSGGHSYAGFSTTTGLLIDVTTMRSFAFDARSGIATFGGGARNADVFAHCRRAGVAITHGRCLSVGVAGLTLGGGVGFNMRAHGVTSDQLVGSEIVTADGTIRQISAAMEPDLFWGCRGAGGGNFGINTSLSFQTFPVDRLTAYDLRWGSDIERVFAALVTALEAAPDTLGCKLTASRAAPAHGGSDAIEVQLLGQFYGTPDRLREILQPAYAIAAPTRVVFLEELAYWDAQDKLSEPGDPEYFQERARFFDRTIDAAVVAMAFEPLRRWPATARAASFKLFETGGRMNAVAADATAFVHRRSHWLSSIGVVWEATTSPAEIQRNLAWQAEFYAEVVAAAGGGGAFANFIDPSLQDWQRAYYGSNLARLERLKQSVDPAHVFTFAQAIP